MVVETVLYERLGVPHDASDDQIRRSYRKAALQWHPDRNRNNPEAAERFKACLEAYEILSNPNQRILYDTYGLGGVIRTASPAAQQTQSSQPQASTNYRPSRRQTRHMDSFFDNDFFSSSPFPPHAYTQTQSSSSRGNPGFSFSASWSFTSSTNGGDGSYTTHYQSWNSRDGHQSRRSSGTFGPGSHAVNSNSRRRQQEQQAQQQEQAQYQRRQQQQQQQHTTTRNGIPTTGQTQDVHDMNGMDDLFTQNMQNLQAMHNRLHSGGGMFGFGPFGNMGGFSGIFNSMANEFPNVFGYSMFGTQGTGRNEIGNGRQQTNSQYRQR